MVIANPIYDVVFKRLMENDKVAKFFVGTLLDTVVERIEVKPQEFTYTDELAGLAVFRLDFIATIRTAAGELKKVLIEIQKARNQIDLMRFRNYLGEQYKREDTVEGRKAALPITTIYILGFTLPDIETPCIKVERHYRDLINNILIERKSDFVEKLSHDCYVVQVDRITDRYQTRLDKLLSIFEQRHFTDDTKIVKEYRHQPDNEEVKLATELLHFAGTNPAERKKIEVEQEAWRTINAMFEDREQELLKTIDNQAKAMAEQARAMAEQAKMIEELKKRLDG
jgi:hypothetical protein